MEHGTGDHPPRERPLPPGAIIIIPIAVALFVVTFVSALGELLLHQPGENWSVIVALTFAAVVMLGAAFLSWREGSVQRK